MDIRTDHLPGRGRVALRPRPPEAPHDRPRQNPLVLLAMPLSDLVLSDLVLSDLVLADLVLADLVLADLVLADLVLADLVLEDRGPCADEAGHAELGRATSQRRFLDLG